MDETELRTRMLEDHAMLRGKAGVLEALALRILRGDEDLGSALRLKGEEIQTHLVRHISWEEREFLPALRRSDGAEIACQISAEHKRQRERIARTLVTLQGSERDPMAVARHMMEFARQLENDLQDEEERILRQGLVAADAPSPDGPAAARNDCDDVT